MWKKNCDWFRQTDQLTEMTNHRIESRALEYLTLRHCLCNFCCCYCRCFYFFFVVFYWCESLAIQAHPSRPDRQIKSPGNVQLTKHEHLKNWTETFALKTKRNVSKIEREKKVCYFFITFTKNWNCLMFAFFDSFMKKIFHVYFSNVIKKMSAYVPDWKQFW